MSAGRVLLVVDLEGVVGVDSVSALVAGTPQYAQARAELTREINATVEGLLGAGFLHVRVSNSHMSGSGAPNVLPDALHPAAELRFEEDWYSASVFEGVQAVGCLGMHAPGGVRGFAAHTVDPLGSWECAGRLLSEADIVLALAAEAGVPALFVAGDDVLHAHLGDRVPFVRTKVSLSPTHAASRPSEEVLADLSRAASLAPTAPRPLPEAPLRLVFKSARQAALAAQTGARRVERHQVQVSGASFRERYQQALRAASAAGSVLESTLRGPVGSAGFIEDVSALLCMSSVPASPRPSRAEPVERALRAFLRLTEGSDDESRALASPHPAHARGPCSAGLQPLAARPHPGAGRGGALRRSQGPGQTRGAGAGHGTRGCLVRAPGARPGVLRPTHLGAARLPGAPRGRVLLPSCVADGRAGHGLWRGRAPTLSGAPPREATRSQRTSTGSRTCA